MLEVYRIEDKHGNGTYFYRDGRLKVDINEKSDDKYLCSFINSIRFTESSYIEFLNDDNYILYKLTLTDYLYKNCYGEVDFLEEHISNIEICNKKICMTRN